MNLIYIKPMLSSKKALASLLIVTVLAGCTEGGLTNKAGNVNKSNVGGLTGAIAGAWIGSNVGKGKGNIAAIAAGTLLGAFAGHSLGSSLDKADETYAAQASQNALEYSKTGTASTWKNPDSGHSGSIIPTKTYYEGSTYCREFTQTISVDGRSERAHGRACRQPDGTWKIIN
jgi:surface antigen